MRRFKNHQLRSMLEAKVRDRIVDAGFTPQYEVERLEYTKPASTHTYTPDFKLSANVYLECKGIWDSEDRKKILLVMEQFPEITICMAFQNADKRLYPGSPTTYGDWATEHGIPWIDVRRENIPAEWLESGDVEGS